MGKYIEKTGTKGLLGCKQTNEGAFFCESEGG